MQTIFIKYFDPDMPKLEKTEKGDLIDLRVRLADVCNNDKFLIETILKSKILVPIKSNDETHIIDYKKGDVVIVHFGVSMMLPHGFEAHLVPRSGTFKNYGLLLTNSVGIIDNSYRGDSDEWIGVFYATRDGSLQEYDRVAQFRIEKNMDSIKFVELDKLIAKNRGGFDTSGVK